MFCLVGKVFGTHFWWKKIDAEDSDTFCKRIFAMVAQRLLLVFGAVGCAILLGIAGCSKSSSSGGGSPSAPSSQEEEAARELAKAKQESINNLKELALAMHNYESAMLVLPTPGYVLDKKTPPPAVPFDVVSWRVKVLPYIEQSNLYRQIMGEGQINPFMPIPDSIAKTPIKLYMNPLKAKTPSPDTHYRVFVGGGAIFQPERGTRIAQIADGSSHTILIVESADPVSWSKPEDFEYDPSKPLPKLGLFPGGFHAAMADGSVRWIPSDTPEATIKAMISMAGNETVQLPGKRVDVPDGAGSAGEGSGAAAKKTSGNAEAGGMDTGKSPKKAPVEMDPVSKVRLAAARVQSSNNLKQLGLALHFYHESMGRFPSPGLLKDMKAPMGLSSPHSWRVSILPYIEQDNLFRLIPQNGMAPLPSQVTETVIKTYLSPISKESKPFANYRVFVGNGAAFEWGKEIRMAEFTDGMSNTILAVDCADPISWSISDDFQYDPKKPLPKLGIFPGGFHALMGDGSVRWIPASTPEATIRAMITRNGNETFELP